MNQFTWSWADLSKNGYQRQKIKVDRKKSKNFRQTAFQVFRHSKFLVLLFLCALDFTNNSSAQTTISWGATSGGTAWYGATNWSPARSGSSGTNNWLTTDVAQLNNTGSANTYGINVGPSSSSAGGSLSIGAIQVSSDRTRGAAIGASVTNSAATLTLNGVTLDGMANSILQNSSSNSLTIRDNDSGSGKFLSVVLGNTTDNKVLIDGAGSITISSAIQGASKRMSLISSGTGTLTLSGNNTFDGGFFLNSGVLRIETNSTGGVTALGTGDLNVSGGRVGTASSSVVLTNNISATGDFSVGVGGGSAFSGNVNLNNGLRTITMANSSTFSGTFSNGGVAIKDGILNLGTTGLIQSNVTISLIGTNSSAGLNFSNISASSLTLNNFSATTNTSLLLGSKNLTVGGDNSSTTLRADITGSGNITKNGTGTLTFGASGNTNYSGNTFLKEGAIAIASDNAFGTGAVTVASGAQIGASSTGARSIANAINANGDFTLGGISGGASLTLNGNLNLVGSGNRTLTYGNSATINGGITSAGGGLVVNGIGATNQRLLISSDASSVNGLEIQGGNVVLTNSGVISTSGRVNVSGSTAAATFDISAITNNSTSVGSIASGANGSVVLGSKELQVGSDGTSSTLNGAVSGAGSLTKNGAGALTLAASNSYTGATKVNGGTLIVNGSLASSNTIVSAGATLGGSGFLQAVTLNGGTIAPGNSPGVLTMQNLDASNGNFVFELGAPTDRGTTYDAINVAQNLVFGANTAFQFSVFGGYSFAENNTYDLFDWGTSFDPGSFNTDVLKTALNTGINLSSSGLTWNVDNFLRDGTISVALIPEPSTPALLGIGLAALAGLRASRRRKI